MTSMREKIATRLVMLYLDNDGPLDGFTEADVILDVLMEPTPGMVDAGVSFALSVTLSGSYNWSQYVTDKHRNMIEAARSER